jgi:nucleoside-diphosphate-sugar epimerase
MPSYVDNLTFPSQLASEIRNCGGRFIVTGTGGWMGRVVAEMLDRALGENSPTRISLYGTTPRNLTLLSGRTLPVQAFDMIAQAQGPAYFFHCGFLTRDKVAAMPLNDYVAANTHISDRVIAGMEAAQAKGIFMPSSGAVYKPGTHVLDKNLETNPYGVLKAGDEQRFLKFAAERDIPTCIPRVFNLSGPFINKPEIYALASFLTQALARQPITIKAQHRVVRSYVHIADLITLAVAMLLSPHEDAPPVFDTAGEDDVELSDLASKIVEVLGQPELAINRPKILPGAENVYVGQPGQMTAIMDHYGYAERDLAAQILDTADYLSGSPRMAAA